MNKFITMNNAEVESLKIDKIIGNYQPEYLYGNIKPDNKGVSL